MEERLLANLRRRLQKLECRRQEDKSFELPPGEGRRQLEAQIAAVRLRLKPEMESEGYVAPDPELVKAMIHAHLEDNRLRREENERLCEAHQRSRAFPTRRFST
jgi:hypothetical protein